MSGSGYQPRPIKGQKQTPPPSGGSSVKPPPGMDQTTVEAALALFQIIATLKLPKSTRLIGTREGTEVHRPDGVSYLVKAIPPRVERQG